MMCTDCSGTGRDLNAMANGIAILGSPVLTPRTRCDSCNGTGAAA